MNPRHSAARHAGPRQTERWLTEQRRRELWLAVLVAALVLAITGVSLRVLLDTEPAVERVSSASAGLPSGLPAVGALVETTIDPGGDVVVRHWVRGGSPIRELTWAPPVVAGAVDPAVADLRVSADGLPGRVVPSDGTVPDTLAVQPPARVVLLTYRLTGVVQRSDSTADRALVWATALDVTHAGPTRVVVTGGVRSMACTRTPEAAPRPCGTPVARHWEVLLPESHRDPVIQVQVDLAS